MRVFIAAVAGLLGSAAFQMSVDAGYARNFIWLIPWCWGGCAALWTAWALMHDKIAKEWLKGLHEKLGKGVYAVRTLICLCVFFAVSLMVGHWTSKTVKAAPATGQSSPAQGNTQSNTVNGDKNNTGNINQNGTGNNAVVGNGNKVGNTYNLNAGPKLSDWLVPGKLPTPETKCPLPPLKFDVVQLFFGNSATFVPLKDAWFPHTVISVDEKPKLIINRDNKGRIALSVDIFDERGYIVAQIENNKFTINANNYFKMNRTANTLVVVDQRNQKVLDFTFLNPRAIQLEALLHFPELHTPIVLSPDGNVYGGNQFGTCSGANRIDINLSSAGHPRPH
jgi:hypothetical protein